MACKLEIVMSRQEFQSRMQAFVDQIKSTPMWDESKEMLIPGELEYRTERMRRVEGIPLPASLYRELLALGEELGVTPTI